MPEVLSPSANTGSISTLPQSLGVPHNHAKTDVGADLVCSWGSAQGSEEAIPVGTTRPRQLISVLVRLPRGCI